MQEKDSGLTKIRLSIGAKLITIITLIVLTSLGSIIFLASWLMRGDLQIIAEENNFNTNASSAAAAEMVFKNIHSNSLILIKNITAVGTRSALARESLDFFFEQNPQVAALFFTAGTWQDEIFINERFFEDGQTDSSTALFYRNANRDALTRAAAGETVLLNAAPDFASPLLALFFPLSSGGGGGVLFDVTELSDSFSSGVSHCYLINDAGDILIHDDFSMARNAANAADRDFTRYVWGNSAASAQTLYTEEGTRYIGAFTKLHTAGAVVITNIEYNKVFEGINATTRRNLYLTITVLSISIILIWFFSRTISTRLKLLAAAAHEIEGGSFDIKLQPKARDEIGVLTASFMRMCKALSVFGRFTNRDIAVRAMRGEIKPGGATKPATIFFSDIRNFTAISENFTQTFQDEASDLIVQWLNSYLTKMVECVEKTGGVVDKFIGDALMAHWGTAYTSGSTRKDAYNCIAAALMMRRALRRINKGRSKDDLTNPRISIGCGINTGMVTAGQIGSDIRMEYTVIGAPVNIASRVESLNKTFGTDILITEDTWKLVRKRFITEEMPSVTVKGKETPLRIFAVINFAKNKKGPKSLVRLRRILGIKPPDILKIDANSKEKKYKIVGTDL